LVRPRHPRRSSSPMEADATRDDEGSADDRRSIPPCARSRRRAIVPLLVLGSLIAAITANLAIGAAHPYPGVALGSGLLLILERTIATWAIALTALVVGD